MNEKQEVMIGEAAKQLADNPVFAGAVDAVRRAIVTSLEQSGMGDASTHNKLTIALQLLAQIERQIKTQIETGKMAALQIDESLGKRLMRAVR